MAIKRKIVCDVCGIEYEEEADGAGFPYWGSVQGVQLNGVANPSLCPTHLGIVMDKLDRLAGGCNGVD